MRPAKLIFIFLAVALAAVIIFFAVNFAFAPDPGEGEKAEKGYTLCRKVIADAETYLASNGHYPPSFDSLAVNYSDQLKLELKEYNVRYEVPGRPRNFTLTFTYTGPGVNHCTYSSVTKKWDCSGYY